MTGFVPALEVTDWAALVYRDDETPVEKGEVAAEATIPAALRRRMARFERGVARCVLGVCPGEGPMELTLGSRYGNMTTAAGLLESIAEGELMSPMKFSLSVHNAICGILNQLRKDRSPHFAISAGAQTLPATLTDACLRVGETEAGACHVAVIGDVPLPEIYRQFDPDSGSGALVALRLAPADMADRVAGGPLLPSGLAGLHALLAGLEQGRTRLCLAGRDWRWA